MDTHSLEASGRAASGVRAGVLLAVVLIATLVPASAEARSGAPQDTIRLSVEDAVRRVVTENEEREREHQQERLGDDF
ncbi:MAG: hypothetical protein ABEJ46_00340, partial [Gemmatimonadota bacterium]